MESTNKTSAASERPTKTPLSVLHIIGATAAGGAEVLVCDLAVGFPKDRITASVFALSGNRDRVGVKLRNKLQARGIPFQSGPLGAVRFQALLKLRKYIRNENFDLVHLHTPNTELAFALCTLGLRNKPPTIRTIHSTKQHLNAALRWAMFKNNSAVSIACSSSAVSGHPKQLGPVIVIPNGVDFSWPIANQENSVEARRKLALNQNAFHFIHVGSMRGASLEVAPKAHNVILEAWKLLGNTGGNAQLHLLGDGNLRLKLEERYGDLPGVHFWGNQPNVTDWLTASDTFLLPSRHEGLPMAGIEAIGTGLPCIFTSIPELRELLPPSVKWVEQDNPHELANAMKESLVKNGLPALEDIHRFREKCGVSRTISLYTKHYESISLVKNFRTRRSHST